MNARLLLLLVALVPTFSRAKSLEVVHGSPSAPLEIVSYTALTCDHCAHFHLKLMPKITEKYITSGKIRMISRDFPIDGVALKAAALVHAFPDQQDKLTRKLYETQKDWVGAQDLTMAFSKVTEIPLEKVKEVTEDKSRLNAIVQEAQQAQEVNKIDRVPVLLVNKKIIVAPQTIEEFDKIIDASQKGENMNG